ncbi:YqiA/YcfP family alpha/beta fold hydrolase [Marinobacterium weihaiense]|uniref:Alpha/beta fold hydrolase n=1 Tax=Marinobacterium weihaiense TaxID=2851016 RepID=A0ABS6M9G3_9GAMM|nr:YqiA/YcfP family alpha/beta fold hydrolase [Marinobacterium weihaiense]MBV0932417.1 alpha/beta fold hydrolase [Marinobacterium weihaiense]
MSDGQVIYVHGFNSSPQSWKARQLQAHMAAQGQAHRFRAPKLSHWPAEAITQLQAEIDAAAAPVTLVGSSLGGYYSTWLVEHNPGVRAVLVNPAVTPYRLLEAWLGENANLYTDEHYQLTPEHLAQLKALDCPALHNSAAYLLLVQTADETLDYREAVDKYADCPRFIQPGGSHGFEQFEALIPAVLAFAEGRIELPEARPLPVASL